MKHPRVSWLLYEEYYKQKNEELNREIEKNTNKILEKVKDNRLELIEENEKKIAKLAEINRTVKKEIEKEREDFRIKPKVIEFGNEIKYMATLREDGKYGLNWATAGSGWNFAGYILKDELIELITTGKVR